MIEQYVTSPYSASYDIKGIDSLPKLFIHSKKDKSVPFEQGKQVFNNALEPKEFWEYEGEHLKAIVKFPESFIEKVNSFLN